MSPEDRVLEHYSNPYHQYRPPKLGDFLTGYARNKICDDWIYCLIKITTDDVKRIAGVWWEGAGCCFSQAAASMLAKHFEEILLDEAKAFTQDDMLDLFQVDIDPNRIECVMVAFNAIQNVLEKIS